MTQYEIRYQTREMWENDEWGTYYHDKWGEAIEEAWELRKDPDLVVIQLCEIRIITFKNESEE